MSEKCTVEFVRQWFDTFIETSLSDEMKRDSMITIKLEHSKHVAAIARELAEEMLWPEDDTDAAEIIGLLHDVGRFAQVAEFGTFRDAHSFDHGMRGYDTLIEKGVLDAMPALLRTGILHGVRCHNLRELPEDVANGPGGHLAKLIRDADKLDIFRVVQEAMRSNSLRARLTTALKIDFDGPVSEGALDDVLHKGTVRNEHIASGADFQLMQISWVFDINYHPTFVRIDSSGIIEDIIATIPPNGGSEQAFTMIRETLAKGTSSFCG